MWNGIQSRHAASVHTNTPAHSLSQRARLRLAGRVAHSRRFLEVYTASRKLDGGSEVGKGHETDYSFTRSFFALPLVNQRAVGRLMDRI